MRHEPPNLAKQIGSAIAKYRQAAGLTQAQVAELLNISNDAVSRMERGTITPSATRLIQLAQIFQCEAAELLTEGSPLIHDQARKITVLLSSLHEAERAQLLGIIESMVLWYQNGRR